MTEKRFTYGSWARYPTFLIIDNEKGKEYDTTEICKVLNEQHEIIEEQEEYIKDLQIQVKGFKKDYNDAGDYIKKRENKIQEILQKHYNKYNHGTFTSDSMQVAIKLICKELGVELK